VKDDMAERDDETRSTKKHYDATLKREGERVKGDRAKRDKVL